MNPAEVLSVEVRGKWFPAVGAAPPRHVLGPIRFALARGERVVLTGPSGCGKTTLLNLVAGLDRDFEGRIALPAGGRLAYVFQEPRLLPWRTVEENLALVLPASEEAGTRVAEVLAEVGLEGARRSYASRLSLGMARRAALARGFVVRPDILLLDEPFVSLDERTARRLRRLLLDLLATYRTTMLFVTHNLDEAVMLADRLLVLTASPARVAEDIPVALDARQRLDARAVAAFRARHPALAPLVDEEAEAGDALELRA